MRRKGEDLFQMRADRLQLVIQISATMFGAETHWNVSRQVEVSHLKVGLV